MVVLRLTVMSNWVLFCIIIGKGSPFPLLGSQPVGDASHKPGGRLPLLSAKPAATLATFKRAATNFAAW